MSSNSQISDNQRKHTAEPAKGCDDLEALARNKAKILAVDDEDVMAEITAFMLTSEGYFVETATNADICVRSLLPISR